MTTRVPFFKMNGIGNKIIVADMRACTDEVTPQAAVALNSGSDTAFDQLMAVHAPREADRDASIKILNSDGSGAEACGNGTRCVVQWLNAETGKTDFSFQTVAGRLDAKLRDNGLIAVNMGVPRFDWDQIPLSEEFADTTGIELQVGPIDDPILHTPSVANMGNPHVIFWADRDVNSYGLDKFGPMLEHHMLFPDRANISIVQVTAENELTMRTWERGAGLTQACGSAACAAAVSAARTGRTGRSVKTHLPGGTLQIDWLDNDFVIMTGPAELEFAGYLDPLSGEWEHAS